MRLIDADALLDKLLPIACGLEHEYGSLGGAVSGVMKHIEVAPTIDAVPVVRCKECKKRGTPDCAMWYQCSVCGGQWSWETNDGFCSYGERKEGASHA